MSKIDLYINDHIGNQFDGDRLVSTGILGSQIQRILAKNLEANEIILHINSPGGSVYEGNFIHNILQTWKQMTGGKILAYIEFMCASIATRIAAIADKRYIARNGQWMVHEASGGGFGKSSVLKDAATELDIINAGLVNDYKRLTKRNKEDIKALMAEDRYMTAAEAIEWGFCDGYLDQVPTNLKQFSGPVNLYSPIAMAYQDYTGDNLGYKRSEMPQISLEMFETFLAYFKAKYGESIVEMGQMPIDGMLPTQSEFNEDKIKDKITSGDWANRNYILSDDNHLLDGHHDWAAGLESDPSTQVDYTKILLPIQELIAEANQLKITEQEAVNAHKAKTTFMNRINMRAHNLAARAQRAMIKTFPTACGDMKPSNLMGTLADGTTMVEYDTLEVGGKVELYGADGSLSPAPAGELTIDGTTVTVDETGTITAAGSSDPAPEDAQALATAQARISELEAENVALKATNTAHEATIEASNKLYESMTAKMTAMAAIVPAAPAGNPGPQNQGKGTADKVTVFQPKIDENSIVAKAARMAY